MLRDFVICYLLIFAFSTHSNAAGNRALLIGISQYSELNSLRYADADALEFSQLLTDFAGYNKSEVTLLLNLQATKKRIVDEINKVVRSSKKEHLDTFILVFAGHGMESTLTAHNMKEDGRNKKTNIFLAPSDASTEENNFYSEGKQVSNDTFINKAWLARQLSAIQAKSIIIVLDSCYSGTRSFGALFVENEGYSIESFGPTSGSERGVAITKRNLLISASKQEAVQETKRIAYLASSRDDQASAEYEELRHGALSYTIFQYVKRVQREVYSDETQELTMDRTYSNITKLFHDTKVNGQALDKSHQPLLLPIPNFANVKNMAFITVRGVKERDILKEQAEKEALRQEELRKESLRKEAILQEALRKEALRKEVLRKEVLRKEVLRKEALRKEAIRNEGQRREGLRKEDLKKEELRKEAILKESLRKEALLKESLRIEALRQESLRKEVLRQESLRKEALWQEFLRKEALRQEETRKEEFLKKKSREGILIVKTEPPGLVMFVDGLKRKEVTNASLTLPAGKHSIELYLPSTGYRHSFTANISNVLPVSKTLSIRGELEVASYWVKDGAKSRGPQLDVFIDGVLVGKSQLRKDNLMAGTHQIEVRYKDVKKARSVEIRPNSPLRINYSVIVEAAPKADKSGISNVVF
ncbi:MAG: caspase family protein [Gallionellaceae bacterium]